VDLDGGIIPPTDGAEVFERVRAALASFETLPVVMTRTGPSPDWSAIAYRAGLPRYKVSRAHTRTYQLVLDRFRQAREAGALPPAKVPAPLTPAECARRLETYFDHIKAEGGQLPASQTKEGSVDFRRLAEEAGVPLDWLRTKKHRVTELRRDVPVEQWRPRTAEDRFSELTYGEFKQLGTDFRRREVAGKAMEKQYLANARSALNKWMVALGKDETCRIGSDLGLGFERTLEGIASGIENKDSRRSFEKEMRRWPEHLRTAAAEAGLPSDGIDVIEQLMSENAIGGTMLARRAGCSRAFGKQIYKWIARTAVPEEHYKQDLHRVERYFKLPEGAIVGRITFCQRAARKIDRELFPKEFTARDRRAIQRYLPDGWESLKEDERHADAREKLEQARATDIQYRKRARQLQKLRYKHTGPLPEMAAEEFALMCRIGGEELTPRDQRPPAPGERRRQPPRKWTAKTQEREELLLRAFIGLLSLDISAGGVGLEPSRFTLALLAVPSAVLWIRDQYLARNPNGHGTVSMLFARALALMNPEGRYARRFAHTARRLPLIDGVIGAETKMEACSDWLAFCRRSHETLLPFQQQLLELVKKRKGRDPFAPILPLLDSPAPMKPMYDLARTLRSLIPPPSRAWTNARAVLKHVIIEVHLDTALRPENLVELLYVERPEEVARWRDDNEEMRIIYFAPAPGRYCIRIHHQRFKNWHSPYFGPANQRMNYLFKLDPSLTPSLHDWFQRARPVLLRGRKTAVAFPSETRADGVLTEAAYRQMFTKLTADHLAYNRLSGAGIPGVEAFGPYNVRHLKASHVLKLTQSFEKAGAAIQDTADTARRHYAKWGPPDANRAIEDINSRLRGAAEDDVPSEDADEGT
jgi:hypothetical protein